MVHLICRIADTVNVLVELVFPDPRGYNFLVLWWVWYFSSLTLHDILDRWNHQTNEPWGYHCSLAVSCRIMYRVSILYYIRGTSKSLLLNYGTICPNNNSTFRGLLCWTHVSIKLTVYECTISKTMVCYCTLCYGWTWWPIIQVLTVG